MNFRKQAAFPSREAPCADCLIVLGARWKSAGPGEVLRRRLDKAVPDLYKGRPGASRKYGRNQDCDHSAFSGTAPAG